MRSSVIAQELIDRGYTVIFVGDVGEIPWVQEYISRLGFKEILTSKDAFISDPKQDILILDSYEVSVKDQFIQPFNWHRILVLVDDATPAYSADVYVHPGAKTNWRISSSAPSSIFVAGLEYLLIRKSLHKLKAEVGRVSGSRVNFLISSGGSDPFKFAENLVRLISYYEFQFHAFVLAPGFILPDGDSRFEIIKLGNQYEEILKRVDFVLTTAGSSSWEYLYLGLPVALAKAVQNQEQNYRFQIDNGFCLDFGQRSADDVWQFNNLLIERLLADSWSDEFKKCKDFEPNIGDGARNILEILFSEYWISR